MGHSMKLKESLAHVVLQHNIEEVDNSNCVCESRIVYSSMVCMLYVCMNCDKRVWVYDSCSALLEYRLLLLQEIAPSVPVLGTGVFKGCESSLIGKKRKIRSCFEQELHNLKVWLGGPASIVKCHASSIVLDVNWDFDFFQEVLDHLSV